MIRGAASFANRALAREDWARERLAAHAGRKLRIVAGPAALTLTINADGSFVDSDETPDLTLTIPALRLPTPANVPSRKVSIWSPAPVLEPALLAFFAAISAPGLHPDCPSNTACPQPIDATVRPNTSDGFIQFKVCRGRLLSSRATAFS